MKPEITETTYMIIVGGLIYASGKYEDMKNKLKSEEEYFSMLKIYQGIETDIMPSELYYSRLHDGVYTN